MLKKTLLHRDVVDGRFGMRVLRSAVAIPWRGREGRMAVGDRVHDAARDTQKKM